MFKLKYVPEDDQRVGLRNGSRRRAVAKRQLRELAYIGELRHLYYRGRAEWLLRPYDSPRASQYQRYKEYCRWFGVRY